MKEWDAEAVREGRRLLACELDLCQRIRNVARFGYTADEVGLRFGLEPDIIRTVLANGRIKVQRRLET